LLGIEAPLVLVLETLDRLEVLPVDVGHSGNVAAKLAGI
jgi:hypothetical protein